MATETAFDPKAYLSAKRQRPTEEDFDPKAYLAAKTAPNPLVDAARSIPGALDKGVSYILGMPGDIARMDLSPDYVEGLGGEQVPVRKHPFEKTHPEVAKWLPGGQQISEAVAAPFGGLYEPKTGLGKFTETAVSFAPALLGGEASLPSRLATRLAAPAAGSMAGEAATKGTRFEPAGALLGMALGGWGGARGARALGNAAERVRGVTAQQVANFREPLHLEDAQLVRDYERMGGHLRPGQYSGNQLLKQGDAVVAESVVPRATGFGPNSETRILPSQQKDDFYRFLAREIGQDGTRITEPMLNAADDQIRRTYEQILPRNSISTSPELTTALGNVETELRAAAPAMESGHAERVQNTLEAIRDQLANGTIDGRLYQNWRKRGGLLDELASSKSPTVSRSGVQIRNALDDAFAAQADPWEAPALRMMRDRKRVLETIRPLAAKAPTGELSPAELLRVVNAEYGSAGRAPGNLGTLARVGQRFLKEPPSSGTTERAFWRNIMKQPLTAARVGAENTVALLPSATAGQVINRYINSPAQRRRLLARALENENATTIAGQPSAATLGRALQP